MRTITTSTDKIEYFDAAVWMSERQLIKFTHIAGPDTTGVSLWSSTSGSSTEPLASYTFDSNDSVVIDVTDLIRTMKDATSPIIYVRCNHGGASTHALSYAVKGLINPYSVIIPENGVDEMLITPPRMIYKGTAKFEVRNSSNDSLYFNADTAPFLNTDLFEKEVADDFHIECRDEQKTIFKCNMREKVCGHRYAVVRWISSFGKTRQFVWEVNESKVSANDTISLLPTDSDYNTIKGREDAFTLYLDNLSAYDYWFYADIITSSKVEVSLDGGTSFRQVDVTTKSYTVPDGDAGAMNELKVQVNYRKYDAVIV